MGSDLFNRLVLPDDAFDGVMRQVWSPTPWIVDAYTGSHDDPRDRLMFEWCYDNLGEQSWPFGQKPRAGRWFRGSATVFGWTWYGFSTEADMERFTQAWPIPEELASQAGT